MPSTYSSSPRSAPFRLSYTSYKCHKALQHQHHCTPVPELTACCKKYIFCRLVRIDSNFVVHSVGAVPAFIMQEA